MFVTKDAAVLNASAGSTPGKPSDSGQVGLQSLEGEQHQHADEREGDHRGGVHRPALVGARVDADGAVDQALDAQVALAGEHPGHVVAQRSVAEPRGRARSRPIWSRPAVVSDISETLREE